MKFLAFGALGLAALVLFLWWLLTSIRYRITPNYLKVALFGVTLRRVPLKDIDSVSKRRGAGLAEHWWNTLRSGHRILVVRRRRGLFKNFVITPRNRYVFRADLERAAKAAQSEGEGGANKNKVSIVSD